MAASNARERAIRVRTLSPFSIRLVDNVGELGALVKLGQRGVTSVFEGGARRRSGDVDADVHADHPSRLCQPDRSRLWVRSKLGQGPAAPPVPDRREWPQM